MRIRIRTDASAAKGIANRRGLGKIRHIEVHQLWLQEKVNRGEIEVMKVKGEGNLADALTKPLDGPGVQKHLKLTGQEIKRGRHEITPDFEAADAPEEMISVDAVAGELEGLECFYTPWGYTGIGAAYQAACPMRPLFGLRRLAEFKKGTQVSRVHQQTKDCQHADGSRTRDTATGELSRVSAARAIVYEYPLIRLEL